MSYTRDPVYGCLLYTGRREKNGYAKPDGRWAHVAAWVAAHGPVPEGFEVEHRCRRRHCANVAHLTLVTRQQNEWRKRWAHRTRQPICDKAHDDIHVIVTPEGGRICRLCRSCGGPRPGLI